jgi:hypothetical protein
MAKVGRNQPCPCGSGQKHKRCCLRASAREAEERLEAWGELVREAGRPGSGVARPRQGSVLAMALALAGCIEVPRR